MNAKSLIGIVVLVSMHCAGCSSTVGRDKIDVEYASYEKRVEHEFVQPLASIVRSILLYRKSEHHWPDRNQLNRLNSKNLGFSILEESTTKSEFVGVIAIDAPEVKVSISMAELASEDRFTTEIAFESGTVDFEGSHEDYFAPVFEEILRLPLVHSPVIQRVYYPNPDKAAKERVIDVSIKSIICVLTNYENHECGIHQ